MEIQKLLGSRSCECGRVHSCQIREAAIGPGALDKIRNAVRNYRHILLVADQNTYRVCGEGVKTRLGERLESLLVYTCEGYLIPDEAAIEQMEGKLTASTDLIVGIGSGVIQDLCKYVSHRAGLPYHIVATAPSMDGYASVGAALILEKRKVTRDAHVPEVIIGDTDILREAPMEMIRAGYGDILGKFSCLNDWKLSHIVNGEYLCEKVWQLTFDMLCRVKDLGERLQERDAEAVQTLMEALVGVGVAMAYVGNSRPASGSEHHLSHFFEVTGILNQEPYLMHGIDVACSAVYTQRLREELLASVDRDGIKEHTFDRETWEAEIRKIYTDAAEGVIRLQDRLGWYQVNRQSIYREKWEEIREVLAQAPSSAEMIRYLNRAGIDLEQFDSLYGAEKISHALKYGKDLKDRYSVLWMYYDLI